MRTGRGKLSLNQDEKLRSTHKIDAETPKFSSIMSLNQFYLFWLFLRRQNHVDQIVPTFFTNRQKEIRNYQLKKTAETYLPSTSSSNLVELTIIKTY